FGSALLERNTTPFSSRWLFYADRRKVGAEGQGTCTPSASAIARVGRIRVFIDLAEISRMAASKLLPVVVMPIQYRVPAFRLVEGIVTLVTPQQAPNSVLVALVPEESTAPGELLPLSA